MDFTPWKVNNNVRKSTVDTGGKMKIAINKCRIKTGCHDSIYGHADVECGSFGTPGTCFGSVNVAICRAEIFGLGSCHDN